MTRNLSLALITIVAVLIPLSMSGCLIQTAKTSKITGAYVQPQAVSQVKVDETTQTEVEQIMGQPSTRTTNDDGTEIWTWNWTQAKGDGGRVFLIFAGTSKETIDQSVHIKFRDRIAIKKWRN